MAFAKAECLVRVRFCSDWFGKRQLAHLDFSSCQESGERVKEPLLRTRDSKFFVPADVKLLLQEEPFATVSTSDEPTLRTRIVVGLNQHPLADPVASVTPAKKAGCTLSFHVFPHSSAEGTRVAFSALCAKKCLPTFS